MLVQCPNCSVHYDHSRGSCVACGTAFEPTEEHLWAEHLSVAIAAMECGTSRRRIVAVMNERGELPERMVEDIADEAAATMRHRSRLQGQQMAAAGFALLFLALVVHVVSLGLVIATGCLLMGSVLAFIGVLKSLTGWNITGNDDPTPATDYDPRHH